MLDEFFGIRIDDNRFSHAFQLVDATDQIVDVRDIHVFERADDFGGGIVELVRHAQPQREIDTVFQIDARFFLI